MPARARGQTDPVRRTLLTMAAIAGGGAVLSPVLGAARMTNAAPSAAPGTLPPDLVKAIGAYDQATTRNDVATLGRLVAEDYLLVNSDSSVQDKRSYLADFEVPGFKVDPYVLQEPVQKVWEEVAVTGGLMHLSWTQDGRQQQRDLRIIHVWARQKGRWRLTYTQLTRVPQ